MEDLTGWNSLTPNVLLQPHYKRQKSMEISNQPLPIAGEGKAKNNS